MSNPIRPTMPITPDQERAFYVAVCERLGLDPAIVSQSNFNVTWSGVEDLGEVRLSAYLPAEELTAMFNGAGRSARGA